MCQGLNGSSVPETVLCVIDLTARQFAVPRGLELAHLSFIVVNKLISTYSTVSNLLRCSSQTVLDNERRGQKSRSHGYRNHYDRLAASEVCC